MKRIGLAFLLTLFAAHLSADGYGQPHTFALGVGYPDLRERLNVLPYLDSEVKVALAENEQAYSARLYVGPLQFGPAGAYLGGEGGVFRYDGQHDLSGDGTFAEPFAGLECRFGGSWMINVDVGPSWIWINSEGQSLNEVQWTVNTALYFFLF